MYVAEDDIWKTWNFLMEDHKIAGAYQRAIKKKLLIQQQINHTLKWIFQID